ncbi:nitrilase-related carbon-nitrogen hydrolase [Arthrobacter sp. JSM 101049]|uniref:nitrilase-related carbon-nitrogen hydrolase n=1 Tax=Arthrobacter sp. JSM 101049 TaxID=929097 RepID=UPI00356A64DD
MSLPTVYCAAGTPGRDPEANLERIRHWAFDARAAGAGLLLTPELFVTAETAGGDAVLRERLRSMARSTGVGIVASTPELTGGRVFVGADWWDRNGQLVAHVRKYRLAAWQRARGFSEWPGRPMFITEQEYMPCEMGYFVALAFDDDAADPAHAYFLRDHGVRRLLVLGETSSRQDVVVPAPAWAGKHTGVPFPQTGPLPEPLLRPLPRVPDAWWAIPARRSPAVLGS